MNISRIEWRKILFAICSGFYSAFCFVVGKNLDVNYTLYYSLPQLLCKLLFWTVVNSVVVYWVWIFFEKLKNKKTHNCKIVCFFVKMDKRIKGWMIVVFLIVMWSPVWLSIFPGAFSYDAYDEWYQFHTGNITAHHPVLHVLYLGSLVEGLYGLTGSYNIGIAVCTFIQMLILACVFSYTIRFMREQEITPVLIIFAILFYGCSPVVKMFAICSTKDTLFSAAFILFVISIWRLCNSKEDFFKNRGWQLMFCLSAFFSMVLRNNGLYVVIIILSILFIINRKYLKKFTLQLCMIASLYFLYVGPFYSALQVTPGGMQEMLSVPLQQLARVYKYEKETYSEEDIQYMYTIIPQENWEQYRSTVADFVKSGFNQEVYREDPRAFWKLWLRVGMNKPMTYINSFMLGIVDYLYPLAVIDGYQDAYGLSSYFDYKVSPPGQEQVIFSNIHSVYESISTDKDTQKIPGLFLLLSPGWYLLIFVQLIIYLCYKKRYSNMLPLMAVLIYFATLLLGPIALVRYVLILYFLFPIYCVFVKNNSVE